MIYSVRPKKAIGLSEDHNIVAQIVVGYPKNIPRVPERAEPQIIKILSWGISGFLKRIISKSVG